MRRLLPALLASLILAFTGPVAFAAETYQEDKHYQIVTPPVPTATPAKIEVVELFWYGCGHCFSFEPLVQAWLKKKPDDVEFRRMPAVFAPQWVPHARAYYAAAALGATEKLHRPLFDAIHVDERKVFTEESLVRFAAEVGIPKAEFTEAYASFAIDGKIKQAMLATRDYGIDGVPSVIVNGKYRVTASLAGGQEAMLKVVDFLVDKERAR